MQRVGGGYRKNTRKNGGGNDPRCGCDMRVGWESSFGSMKQLGGGCAAAACAGPLVPGQIPSQYGGACPCSAGLMMRGGKRKGMKRRGGGCGCAGSSGYTSLVPGLVGGSHNIPVSSGSLDPHASPENIGRTLSNSRATYSSVPVSSGGGCGQQDACPFPGTGYCSEFYAKGGKRNRSRKQKGGNGCGCLAKPFFRGGKRRTLRKRR